MPKMTHDQCSDLFGGDYEPTLTEYLHATIVIKDGRGGIVRFDKSEVNDLIAELAAVLPNDATKVKIVDLTNVTGE